MKKRLLYITMMFLAVIALSSCKDKESQESNKDYSEDTPFILSSQEVDEVFNPFFSSTAPDSTVVGYTQIGMLTNDKDGNVAYGANEPVVVLDYDIVEAGSEAEDNLTTTYYFVLKNNVKFSNGSPLTIKDVLFNLYVYLDPVYSGSSTIYSTDIVGLQEYRTQEDNEKAQDRFMEQFQVLAETRIQALVDAATTIFDENEDQDTLKMDEFKALLAEWTDVDGYENVVVDFDKTCELFKEELNSDYTNSLDTYKDIKLTDSVGNQYPNLIENDVQAFLYNEGYIKWNKKDARLEYTFGEGSKYYSKEEAINGIFNDKLPYSLEEIVYYWATASELYDFLVNEEMSNYMATATRKYKNISGIKFANQNASVKVNGKEYAAPTYANDGSVANDTNEVLSITINGVDPKAIWNFSFSVAPMYYYSDSAHVAAFDFEENFGVEYSSQDFMNNVIKGDDKVKLPVGAGPYQISNSNNEKEGITVNEFCGSGVIYFTRNDHYIGGAPKIKNLRLQVVASNQLINALINNEVDFIQPNSKPELIATLNGYKDRGIGNKSIETSGYGYIGVNASKVPDINVRQIIMHTIDTSKTIDYYGNTATAIYRSMSLSSWAYPKGCTAYYPYLGGAIPEDLDAVNPKYADYVTGLGKKAGQTLSTDEQIAFIEELLDEAEYTLGGDGVYVNRSGHKLKYTFTVAGSDDDHPAWNAFLQAQEILNKVGFDITVTTDAQALSKLTTGDLAVWAAAWSSTIDPDMYQVYHMESKATSVNNWGYPAILQNAQGKYDYEKALLEELSEKIEEGRKTTDNALRAEIYSDALDIVMQLAIELPTYQRDDLFAYNLNKIDGSTLTKDEDLTSYNGLLTNIHKVALNKEK